MSHLPLWVVCGFLASSALQLMQLYCSFLNGDKRKAAPKRQALVSGKVFIQRDYSGGTRCQFQTKFPAELENRIDRQRFEETVRTLNNLYAEAEKLGGQSYLEGSLACLTAYTIFLCMETHYEKVLKKVSKHIQEQNKKIYAPQGLLLTDPIERGLRVIEMTIYEDRGMSSGR